MNELHDRLKSIISNDRYRQGVGELAELTGRGCGFDTMACVFSAYYPE